MNLGTLNVPNTTPGEDSMNKKVEYVNGYKKAVLTLIQLQPIVSRFLAVFLNEQLYLRLNRHLIT